MASLAPIARGAIRFEATEGSGGVKIGVCPRCKGRGDIGKFCVDCCLAENWVMLKCCDCEDIGPIDCRCEKCGGEYGGEASTANCPNCNREGDRGFLCSDCEDTGFVYE
jgi:hypothetical protein